MGRSGNLLAHLGSRMPLLSDGGRVPDGPEKLGRDEWFVKEGADARTQTALQRPVLGRSCDHDSRQCRVMLVQPFHQLDAVAAQESDSTRTQARRLNIHWFEHRWR
jgi:hypothetical protein